MVDSQRRSLVKACLGSTTALLFPFRGLAEVNSSATRTTKSEFERLFNEALAHPEQLAGARRLREAGDDFETRAIAPRGQPSKREISPEASDLIVLFEVTNKGAYQAKYQHPVWPRGNSGVTIGVGYDLGYVTEEWLMADWKGLISETNLEALRQVTRIKGSVAKAWIPKLRDVKIGWEQANSQFHQRVLPLYVGETLRALPAAAAELSNKSLGALVSLVYNRGASFNRTGPRFDEMNNIRDAIIAHEFERIPNEIRSMKRMWDPRELPGLHKRRDMEAALFSEGLA